MGQEISKSSKLIETNFVAKTYFDIDTNNLTYQKLKK